MDQEKILVVDDNPLNMKLIRVLLVGEGYQVKTAADASEALAVLSEFHPRLILMDIQLPGIDGLELTRRLKADPSTRDITIVGLTAYAMKGDEERIRAAGCDGYIPKPIDTRTLPEFIKSYLKDERHTPPSAPRSNSAHANAQRRDCDHRSHRTVRRAD